MRFMSLSVYVEAFRLTEENGEKLAVWCGGTWHPTVKAGYTSAVNIQTLEGTMRAEIGDWIIKGVQGEFYPCKPDVFRLKYETAPRLISICGVDCHPGDSVCNNYCNKAPEKGPMADQCPPGKDAEEYKGFRMS